MNIKLKSFLFVALLAAFGFLPSALSAQTIVGNSVQIYNQLTLKGRKITGITNDSTLVANDSTKIPTEFAVKGYVDNKLTGFSLAIGHTFVVPSQDSMLNLDANIGDVSIIPDSSKSYILKTEPATSFSNWVLIVTPAQVVSAFGRTGNVTAQYGDYDYSQIANTPTIPTDNSELTNGAGYLLPADIAGKVNTSDTAAMLAHYATKNLIPTDNSQLTNGAHYIDTTSGKATNTTLGVVKPGKGIDITDGVVSTKAALLTPKSVPYVASDGELTEDPSGLYWDGQVLHAGHSNFYSSTGLSLNGGRGYFFASGFGLTAGTNGGTPADLSKSITFYNSNLPYLTWKMGSASDSTFYQDTYMTLYPHIDNYFSLGKSNLRWRNIYGQYGHFDSLYINGNYFDPTVVGVGGTGSNNPDSLNDHSGSEYLLQSVADAAYKPIGYVPAWSDITGKPTLFSGDYNDLTNKPTIPTVTGKMNYTDSAAMLSPYLRKVDTTGKWISPAVANATYATITALNLKANSSDLANYVSRIPLIGTYDFASAFSDTYVKFFTSSIDAPTPVGYSGLYIPLSTTTGSEMAIRNNAFYFRTKEAGVLGEWLQLEDRTHAASTYATIARLQDSVTYLKGLLAKKLDTSFKQNLYAQSPVYFSNDSTIAIKDTFATKANPVFTGVAKIDSDTLATKADVRASAGGGGSFPDLSGRNYASDSLAVTTGGLKQWDWYRNGSDVQVLTHVPFNYYPGMFYAVADDSLYASIKSYDSNDKFKFTVYRSNATENFSGNYQYVYSHIRGSESDVTAFAFPSISSIREVEFRYISDVVNIDKLTNLYKITYDSSSVSDVKSFPASLRILNVTDCALSYVDFGDLSAGLNTISVAQCTLSDKFYFTSIPSSLASIVLKFDGLDATAVNNILVALDAATFDGPVSIDLRQGTGAVPSGAGATAKASLITKGNTVTTD
jgi:hypothetical protein